MAHRLQLDMAGFAQLPATCVAGMRCVPNDPAAVRDIFEGSPRRGQLPARASHSSGRASAGWMFELCVEEWHCSLLYTFI